ncbi:hypothetical protein CK221_25685 [Mesorhizobium sp. WSM3868]|nr:hypothetical protein CK221_25685 [Mesorhizobium sp. WSM3868]
MLVWLVLEAQQIEFVSNKLSPSGRRISGYRTSCKQFEKQGPSRRVSEAMQLAAQLSRMRRSNQEAEF